MIFFKMIEALRIREIDQMIESFQKDVARPDILTQVEAPAPTPKIKLQETTPEMNGVVAEPTVAEEATQEVLQEEVATQEEPMSLQESQPDPAVAKFTELVAKIKDRNAALGECFEQQIRFVSYENNVLTWESCADEACKKSLKHGYGVIKQLVRETFSFETSIKGRACSKPIEPKKEEKEQQMPPQPEGAQSASTVEDIEAGGAASCVTNCAEASVQDEKNGTDITKEPMVQKAIEMFEAKKVTIQSKI
jgi:DNA polymerase-3 subunit gamma/tau